MNHKAITYASQSANESDIYDHLDACNDQFIPPLSETVDIKSYAHKLFEKSVIFEAWSGGILVGLIAAYFNDPEHRTGYVTSVSVLKDFGGKGIASALLDACVVYGQTHGFREISLEVHKDNASAIHLYKKFAFEQVEEKDDKLIMKREIISAIHE